MGRAKEIVVKVIPSKIANEFVKKYHYSGKVVNMSFLHFGAFLDDKLHGVLSYGPPMDKMQVINLVTTTNISTKEKWNEMLELNRMAFDDYLPKNSESRCIAVSIRLIKKNAPHIKWLLSYSDATQCGDGAIYRAAGFKLTQIRKNTTIWIFPDGEKYTNISLKSDMKQRAKVCAKYGAKFIASTSMQCFKDIGAKEAEGCQNRYIYILSNDCKINATVIPFSKIDELGIGMYKGEKISISERNKRAESVTVAHSASSREEAFNSTAALNS